MKKILIFFWLLRVIDVNAQAPQRFFTRFGGDGDDIAYSGKPTNDGQYIIAGSSSSYGVAGNTDVYLVKVDSMGFPMWQKFFGGIGNDIGRSVIQLPDSGYMIAGFTNSFGAGGYDVFVIRTDKHGNKIWQETYGGSDWDFAYDLVRGSDGNVFIVGNTSSFGGGKMDGYILKIDLLGNLILQKTVGGLENDELKSIINTNDYNLATVGSTQSMGDILGNHYFIKLNLNADTIITRNFGNQGKSYLNDLVQDGNGDYILVGAETYTDLPFTQSYRVNINSNATLINWEGNSFTSSDEENWKSITKSIAGSPRVSTIRDFYKDGFKKQGSIFSNPPSAFYPTIVNEFGGVEDELLFSNEGTKDGGFLCVGTTESFGSFGKDVYLMKVDSTLISYSSVVGIPKHEIKPENITIKVTELKVQIQFNSKHIPNSLEIYNMNGQIVLNSEDFTEIVSIERQLLKSSIYLFKFIYSDKSFITRKLLIQ